MEKNCGKVFVGRDGYCSTKKKALRQARKTRWLRGIFCPFSRTEVQLLLNIHKEIINLFYSPVSNTLVAVMNVIAFIALQDGRF